MRTKRFQNRITAGRFTLPTAILISVSCWILTAVLLPETETQQSGYSLWETFCDFCIPTWANRLFSFILYAVIGYFLIQLNNTFAIIRMRASVQTSVYFLLISVCPACTCCMRETWQPPPSWWHCFPLQELPAGTAHRQSLPRLCLHRTGQPAFPQLMLFVPIFWIGAYNFQSLQPKVSSLPW